MPTVLGIILLIKSYARGIFYCLLLEKTWCFNRDVDRWQLCKVARISRRQLCAASVTFRLVEQATSAELPNVFVLITKCICLDYKLYLSGLQNVFVWIANCICMWVSGRRGVSEGLKMLTLVQTGSCLKEDRHTSKQTGERTYILSLPEWKQKWKMENGKNTKYKWQ